MEASLPVSAAVDPAPIRKVSPVQSGAVSPPVTLPLRFIVTGLLALTIGLGWLVAQPDVLTIYHYNQWVIAVTHLFVLGWICSVIMGAMYQLVPVALETRLYSERLAKWQFIVHVIGFAGMVWMFKVWNMKQVGHFGSVLALGVGLFVYNIARTLLRVPKWNVTASAVTAALVWISLTIIAGLSIAASKCAYDSTEGLAVARGVSTLVGGLEMVAQLVGRFDQISFMHAHAHLGGVGFFTMLIVGASYKLIPMFTLSEMQSKRRAVWSVALLNIGLAGSFVTIILRSPWKLLFALIMVAALTLYGWELKSILGVRKRRNLDWGVKSFLAAVALFGPLSVLAVVLSWPGLPMNGFTGQLENLYGFLGLIGIVTFAIIGMLYKIIPFLVWQRTYSQHVGLYRVPSLTEMYSELCQVAGFWAHLVGLAVAGVGIILANPIIARVGGGLLMVSLLAFLFNVGRMFRHCFRPQLVSLASRVAEFKNASA